MKGVYQKAGGGTRRAANARTSTLVTAVASTLLLIPFCATLHAQSEKGRPMPTREYHLGAEDKLEITVSVWGEVGTPGSYRVPDDTNLVELISLAGGPTDYANLGGIKITRSNGDGERMLKVDLRDYLDGKSQEAPVILLPGDTVRVPRNAKHAWRSAIQVLSDVAVIATLYVLIHDRHYR